MQKNVFLVIALGLILASGLLPVKIAFASCPVSDCPPRDCSSSCTYYSCSRAGSSIYSIATTIYDNSACSGGKYVNTLPFNDPAGVRRNTLPTSNYYYYCASTPVSGSCADGGCDCAGTCHGGATLDLCGRCSGSCTAANNDCSCPNGNCLPCPIPCTVPYTRAPWCGYNCRNYQNYEWCDNTGAALTSPVDNGTSYSFTTTDSSCNISSEPCSVADRGDNLCGYPPNCTAGDACGVCGGSCPYWWWCGTPYCP